MVFCYLYLGLGHVFSFLLACLLYCLFVKPDLWSRGLCAQGRNDLCITSVICLKIADLLKTS